MATNKPVNRALDRWLLNSIIVLLPSYLLRFHVAGISFNVLDLIIVLGFIMCAWNHRGVRLSRGWWWTMLSFVVITSLAVIVAPDKVAALGLFKSYCVAPILVGMMMLTVRPSLAQLTPPVAVLVTYLSVIAIAQYVTGFGIPAPWNIAGANYRVTSVFDYPNALGLILAPLVIWLMAAYLQRVCRCWWLVVVSGLGLVAIILSQSAGAIVAVGIAFVVMSSYTRYRWLVWLISGGVLLLAILLPTTREILLFQDTSGAVRLALWQGTLNLLWHHPWFGAGLGGFPTLYAEYKLARHVELLLYPHNIFLDFWVEFGLLGLGWLLVTLSQFFKRLYSIVTPEKIVLLSIMIGVLMYGLVDVPYFKNDLAVFFWIILTLSGLNATKEQSVQ